MTATGPHSPLCKADSTTDFLQKKSEHQSYLQGLTGMYINIDFPFLNDLRAEGRLVTIESALLRLYPVKGTYGGQYPLPESLTLYTADENNVTEDVVTGYFRQFRTNRKPGDR